MIDKALPLRIDPEFIAQYRDLPKWCWPDDLDKYCPDCGELIDDAARARAKIQAPDRRPSPPGEK
jgi:hypothetical protein